jgi:C-terminal processing protease CtpA/Prc
MQLTTMVDDYGGYTIDNLFSEVRTAMRDAEEPLKVILDFRANGGGYVHESTLQGFVNACGWYETDGIYILIDGNCFSAGVLAPYYLRQAIEGAKLVGAPTGQGLWFPANSAWYEMPNSGVGFRVGDEITCAQRGWEGDALEPDVLIYQTLEDYKAGIDTVLQYALED